MTHWMLVTGALSGALAVVTGAFGAHALQGVLDERARGWYDTAVTYHARHAFALIACGLTALFADAVAAPATGSANASVWLSSAGVCFLAGTVVFSGSLYTMAFTGVTRLGMITPVGGLLLILGWLCLAAGAFKLSNGVS